MVSKTLRKEHIGEMAVGIITPTSYYVWLSQYVEPLTNLEKTIIRKHGEYHVSAMDSRSSELIYLKRYVKYAYAERGFDHIVREYSKKYWKLFNKWKNQKKL